MRQKLKQGNVPNVPENMFAFPALMRKSARSTCVYRKLLATLVVLSVVSRIAVTFAGYEIDLVVLVEVQED